MMPICSFQPVIEWRWAHRLHFPAGKYCGCGPKYGLQTLENLQAAVTEYKAFCKEVGVDSQARTSPAMRTRTWPL